MENKTIDLTKVASVWADRPGENVSEKYAFVPTSQIVGAFESRGWEPVSARETAVRKPEKRGFQQHMIRFRHRASKPTMDGLHPEVVVYNSHDGSAMLKIMAGLFRLVCANGLVVADTQLQTMRIKHIGYKDQDVHQAIEYVGDNVPNILERVRAFQGVELTGVEREIFGVAALRMRYGDADVDAGRFDSRELVAPIRSSESAPTLWNTYNQVQEKFLNGGRFIKNEKKPRTKKSRKVKSVTEDIRLNRGLWYLAEKMAELRGAA